MWVLGTDLKCSERVVWDFGGLGVVCFLDRISLCIPGTCYTDQAGLRSQRSACFCLSRAGFKGVRHGAHIWYVFLSTEPSFQMNSFIKIIYVIFFRQAFVYGGMTLNSLCIQGWPWTPIFLHLPPKTEMTSLLLWAWLPNKFFNYLSKGLTVGFPFPSPWSLPMIPQQLPDLFHPAQ